MKIEGVVISCYKLDIYLTRACVASVRFWYPKIPIWLLKDEHYGQFDTREIEKCWEAQVYPGRQKTLGWGFGKLEVITELPARRLLLIDSDIVFVGRVIDRLEQFDEDLVVHQVGFDAAGVKEQFFDVEKLAQLDPEFRFRGHGFNSGQIVATTGCIASADFDGLVDWQARKVTHPEVFTMGEQGVLNYVALRKSQQATLSIRHEPFMVWPGLASCAAHLQLQDLNPEGRQQELIHWAGLRWGKALEEMPRSEILLHFEEIYYRQVPFGVVVRQWRRAKFRVVRSCVHPLKNLAKRVFAMLRPSRPFGQASVASARPALPTASHWRGPLWSWIVNLWIGLVLVLFFIIRVLDSNTARNISRSLGVR